MGLKITMSNLEHNVEVWEHFYMFTNDQMDQQCELFSDKVVMCNSVPNPLKWTCNFKRAVIVKLSYIALTLANIALRVVAKEFADTTLGYDQEIYAYYYSRANYLNIKGQNEWEANALEVLRVNMKEQHMQMRRQLQERHKDIANHIGELTRTVLTPNFFNFTAALVTLLIISSIIIVQVKILQMHKTHWVRPLLILKMISTRASLIPKMLLDKGLLTPKTLLDKVS